MIKNGCRINVTGSLMADILFILRTFTKGCKLHIDLVYGFHRLTEYLRHRENTMLREYLDWRNKK